MLEVRLIMKDGTCAVFKHVVGFQTDMMGSIIYTDDRQMGKLIKWGSIKSIKVVNKFKLGGDIHEAE